MRVVVEQDVGWLDCAVRDVVAVQVGEPNGHVPRDLEHGIYGCISMQRYWSSLRYSFLRTLFLLAAELRRHPTVEYACMYVCMHTYVYVCVCMYTYVYIYTHTHTHTHKHAHKHTHTHTHKHSHKHTHTHTHPCHTRTSLRSLSHTQHGDAY